MSKINYEECLLVSCEIINRFSSHFILIHFYFTQQYFMSNPLPIHFHSYFNYNQPRKNTLMEKVVPTMVYNGSRRETIKGFKSRSCSMGHYLTSNHFSSLPFLSFLLNNICVQSPFSLSRMFERVKCSLWLIHWVLPKDNSLSLVFNVWKDRKIICEDLKQTFNHGINCNQDVNELIPTCKD